MGNRNQRQDNESAVEIVAHIQAPASAQDDARYRSFAEAYLGFEPSQVVVGTAPPDAGQAQDQQRGSPAAANPFLPDLNPTGYIGPTHVGSMSTPPAAQGSAPSATPSTSFLSADSRGFFASQPVLPTVEVPYTPQPFSFSQGDTPTRQSLDFSSPAGPSGQGRASTDEGTHISETTRGGSTVIFETPQRQSPPQSGQFMPSSISSISFGSSVMGNQDSPRPVNPVMGQGPEMLYYPAEPYQGGFELPPPSGQRPVGYEVSETPESRYSPQQSRPLQPSPLQHSMNSSVLGDARSSSPMQLDGDGGVGDSTEELPSLSLQPAMPMPELPSSPPRNPDLMDLTSSPPYGGNDDDRLPPSSQSDYINLIIPNTPSRGSGGGSSQTRNPPPSPLPPLPPPSSSLSSSASLFIPETSPFSASQFPPPSQPLYDPNLEIHGPAAPTPNEQQARAGGGGLVTGPLRDLQSRLDTDGRAFRPATLRLQIRALRPEERGYWVVDTAAWTPRAWLGAWGYLTDFVGGGAAGWGVSVRRDADGSRLRVFCFGAAAEPVWWLLFQASEGRVAATGGRWLDGSGTAVLEMGGRS